MTQEIILQNNKRLSPTTKVLCKCEHCNELIDRFDVQGRERLYKKGHYNRGRSLLRKTRKTRVKTTPGYWKVICKEHPRADTYGYVLEHILVFEDTHSCCVLRWGVIHHRDGIKTNNVWYNLKGMMKWQHSTLHQLKYMDDRKCSGCDSSKTDMQMRRRFATPCWSKDKEPGQFLCCTCASKQYNQDHREQVLAYARQYRQDHREERLAYMRQYYR